MRRRRTSRDFPKTLCKFSIKWTLPMSNSIISKTTRLASPASDDSMRASTSTSTLGLKGLINGSIGIIIWMNGLINGSIGYYYMDEWINKWINRLLLYG